jgi:hypothetical protein
MGVDGAPNSTDSYVENGICTRITDWATKFSDGSSCFETTPTHNFSFRGDYLTYHAITISITKW